MNNILRNRELLMTSASRLTNSEFRYLPYIVIYCFVLYVSVALVFGCILREPRFVVRWTKEKRFSQMTASETDDDENEDEENDENEDEAHDKCENNQPPNRPDSSRNNNGNVNNNHNTSQMGIAMLPDAVPSRQMSQQLQKIMSQHSLRLEIDSNSDENKSNDHDIENNNKKTTKSKEEISTQDLCCRRGGFCHSWGPTYYRYGLHIIFNSIWHDLSIFWNYLLTATRIASFAYLLYYNIYTLLVSKDSPGIWKDFSVWVSCGVVLYFAAVSLISLFFGLCFCLHPQNQQDGRRRAFLIASIVHILYETVMINAYFVALLSYLYFKPTDKELTDGYRYHHIRLFPAIFMCIDGLQNELYIRWQSYPYILLLPGLYLAFQWVLRYLDYINTWQDKVLATESVYAFLAYGGLLLAHLVIYLVLGLGVSWLKIKGKLWCMERLYEQDEYESEEEEEEEADEETAEVENNNEAASNNNADNNNTIVRAEDVAINLNI